MTISTLRFPAGAAAPFLTGRPRRSKPTRLVAAVFLGGLVATGLPVALAGGQETPVRALRASAEPVLSIGPGQGVDSPYELFQVDGAMRLPDGGVVVMVRGHYEVRRFGPDGAHLWSRGRHGEGPGEFKFPVLLTTCSRDNRIVIYDRSQYQVTILDNDGELVDDYLFNFGDRTPYSVIKCAPSGRMVFTPYADQSQMPDREGPYRWVADIVYHDGEGANLRVFRQGIPGADRMLYFVRGVPSSAWPLTWGRTLSIAATDEGAWIGTADSHEIELVDWTGTTIDRIRWDSPDLEVTDDHLDAYRDELHEAYRSGGRDDWEQRFNSYWETERPALPTRFPAYDDIIIADGLIWVRHFRPPGQTEQHWRGFDDDGTRVATMSLPSRMKVQDLGSDWVLAVLTGPLGIERLVVHQLKRNEP